MKSVVIRGGTVIDGTGAPARRADVVVSGSRIESVGEAGRADSVIDASGLVVAPGFFDFHSHADFTIPSYPEAVNSISQGVTTEVTGNCGFSPAPLSLQASHAEAYRASSSGIGPDLRWDWSDFGSFLAKLDDVQPPVNIAPLVGHNAVRSAVMGFEDRAPDERELTAMQALVADAMSEGAWGISSGLIYAPSTYSEVGELAALASVAAARGGIYSSHIRNEGAGLLDAVGEALEVGRLSGATVHVSHLKATGRRNFGLVHRAFDLLDEAREAGGRVYCDVYPYTAGSTFLAMVTPGWAQEGGFGEMVERLRSREQRDRIRRDMETGLPGWNSLYTAIDGWESVLISSVADRSLAAYEGRNIADLAAAEDKDPFEFTFDLLVADRGETVMVVFLMDEPDVHSVLSYPYSVIGSDQLLVTGRDLKVHPRAYGSYARVAGPLVRDAELFPLETAIRKMTGLPASILGMTDRGRVAPGAMADLVLFDPAAVTDRATYADPTLLAEGIERVLLAGRPAYGPDGLTPDRLGRVLRGPGRRAA